MWLIAGANILSIAFQASHGSWDSISTAGALVVFSAFLFLIFSKMVTKHTARIMSFEQLKLPLHYFFDMSSYIVMVFMITLGISIRTFELMPEYYIAMFYAGLGSALIVAGILFLLSFVKVQR